MRALVWHGKEDIRCDTVTNPEIEQPRDAIVKVTSCAICGSDLHLFHNLIPAMLPGDVLGHEMIGEVVEVGPEAKHKLNDRVVGPFTIICGVVLIPLQLPIPFGVPSTLELLRERYCWRTPHPGVGAIMSLVKADCRVRASGVPANQAPSRMRFMAAAVSTCCRCIFASPM